MAELEGMSDMMADVKAKRLSLDNLLLKNQQKLDKLANLNQNIQRTKALLEDKERSLTSKERRIRDGKVVNNRMISDIKTRRAQIWRVDAAAASLESLVEYSLEEQFRNLVANSNQITAMAKALTIAQGDSVDDEFGKLMEKVSEQKAFLKMSGHGRGYSADELRVRIWRCLGKLKRAGQKKQVLKERLAEMEADEAEAVHSSTLINDSGIEF